MTPLNSPLEVGVRALVLLTETYPEPLDLAQLVLLDHAMLHSGELLGPPSLHPDLPARPGELGMKRSLLQDALLVLIRAGLAEVAATEEGLTYQATGRGPGFIDVLEAPYVGQLRQRAEWAVQHYAHEGTNVREATRSITTGWSARSNRDGEAERG